MLDVKLPLDPVVEYPAKAINKIGKSRQIVGLLMNDPNVDMQSETTEDFISEHILSYPFVDETTQEATAYICVDVEGDTTSETVMRMTVYVTVFCTKNFAKIDSKLFPEIVGNRRDNLIRFVDEVLNGNNVFGIGGLQLKSVRTVTAPQQFTAKELAYSTPDFDIYHRGRV